jgi:2,4-dienoyl-CoA reductase-like NADH-dependent reductase (Old Yellow Enzyme family)
MLPDAKIPFGPGYQVAFAERIKKEAKILTGAVGFITEAQQAEDILVRGEADLVLIARESLRNPYFALKAANVSGDDIAWPLQYLRAK